MEEGTTIEEALRPPPTDETNCEDEEFQQYRSPLQHDNISKETDVDNDDDNDSGGNGDSKSLEEEEQRRKRENIEKEYQNELCYLEKISPTQCRINFGFVPNMNVPADIIVNSDLEELLLMELKEAITARSDSFTSEKKKRNFVKKKKESAVQKDGDASGDGGEHMETLDDDKKKEGDVKEGDQRSSELNADDAKQNVVIEAKITAPTHQPIQESQAKNKPPLDGNKKQDDPGMDDLVQSELPTVNEALPPIEEQQRRNDSTKDGNKKKDDPGTVDSIQLKLPTDGKGISLIEKSRTKNDLAKDDDPGTCDSVQSKVPAHEEGLLLCMETLTLDSKSPNQSKKILDVMKDQKTLHEKASAKKGRSNQNNKAKGGGGRVRTHNPSFIPALKQMANVAALPGIVCCLAMPDVHSGYGFCIGNVAAFDMDDDDAVISPGGVGFDINCGVRLIRTNLTESDVQAGEVREKLAQSMFEHLPAGVGTDGVIPVSEEDIDKILETGIDWAISNGYAWPQDKDHCEENGRMETAIPKKVSERAKKRGLNQLGTLGGGNHYAEVQVVEEVYDEHAARIMGIQNIGQVCIMIHTGSRGLGHQVATDAIKTMEKKMKKNKIPLNDRQLCCARIKSKEGQDYLAAMSAAANYAWVNRSCITYLTRKVFEQMFEKTAEEMDMELVYDVCHNVAKIEKHIVSDGKDDGSKDGKNVQEKTLLVHRKGSTRAFPPNHPSIPKDYQSIGQPALIGGSMGTCSYVLVGTNTGMENTFGSTCHGAGRALSRNASRKRLKHTEVLQHLKDKNISIRVTNPKLVTEEAPESYKDVSNVVDTCHDAGISRKVVKLRPIAVVKG